LSRFQIWYTFTCAASTESGDAGAKDDGGGSPELDPWDFMEILCGGKVVSHTMSLASARVHLWKKSTPVKFEYRPKQEYWVCGRELCIQFVGPDIYICVYISVFNRYGAVRKLYPLTRHLNFGGSLPPSQQSRLCTNHSSKHWISSLSHRGSDACAGGDEGNWECCLPSIFVAALIPLRAWLCVCFMQHVWSATSGHLTTGRRC
jgi:hypothetical protein